MADPPLIDRLQVYAEINLTGKDFVVFRVVGVASPAFREGEVTVYWHNAELSEGTH